jgi:hypothetical protein
LILLGLCAALILSVISSQNEEANAQVRDNRQTVRVAALKRVMDVAITCRPIKVYNPDAGISQLVTGITNPDAGMTTFDEVAMVPSSGCTETTYWFHRGTPQAQITTAGAGGARAVGHNNGNAFVEGPVDNLSSVLFCAIASDGGCAWAGQAGQR